MTCMYFILHCTISSSPTSRLTTLQSMVDHKNRGLDLCSTRQNAIHATESKTRINKEQRVHDTDASSSVIHHHQMQSQKTEEPSKPQTGSQTAPTAKTANQIKLESRDGYLGVRQRQGIGNMPPRRIGIGKTYHAVSRSTSHGGSCLYMTV